MTHFTNSSAEAFRGWPDNFTIPGATEGTYETPPAREPHPGADAYRSGQPYAEQAAEASRPLSAAVAAGAMIRFAGQ